MITRRMQRLEDSAEAGRSLQLHLAEALVGPEDPKVAARNGGSLRPGRGRG